MERLCFVVTVAALLAACGLGNDSADEGSSALATESDMLIGYWLSDTRPEWPCGSAFFFSGMEQFRHVKICESGRAQVSDGVYQASGNQLTVIPKESTCSTATAATWVFDVLNGDTLVLENQAGIIAFDRRDDWESESDSMPGSSSAGVILYGCYQGSGGSTGFVARPKLPL